MDLQPKRVKIVGQKEFLNTTQGLVYKVGGVTLDSSKFTKGEYVKAGSAVALTDSGLAEPFSFNGETGEANGIPYIVSNDVKIPAEGGNVIVGVLEAGYLKESVVTDGGKVTVPVTEDFINSSNGRFHLR